VCECVCVCVCVCVSVSVCVCVCVCVCVWCLGMCMCVCLQNRESVTFVSLPPTSFILHPSSFSPSLTLLSSAPLLYHSHPLLLLESYRTRFLRAEGASEDAELAALAHLVEQSCKIASGGSKVQSSFPSVRGGLR
jgi:hypothetical protein